MTFRAPLRLRAPESIQWVQDSGSVLLVDVKRNISLPLFGREAAVWIWLGLSYSWGEIAEMLSAAEGIPPAEAEETLGRILRLWRDSGWLEQDGGRDG